jgi:hypothetical protein
MPCGDETGRALSDSFHDERRVRAPEEWLTLALLRMALEHCARPEATLDSFGWRSNAEAMRILAQDGFIRIDAEDGDRIRAAVVPEEVDPFLAWMAKAEADTPV